MPVKDHRPHILFTSAIQAPFIAEDLRLLEEEYTVTAVLDHGVPAIFRYVKNVFLADQMFSWFASVHSSIVVFLARAVRKPSIVVLGGVDVAKEKELGYGIWLSKWRSIFVRYALTHASVVLAVDQSLKDSAVRLARYNGSNIRVLPTGYDSERWKPSGTKEPIVLSVGVCPDMARIRVKGYDVLLQAATRLRDTRFIIVGIDEALLKNLTVPDNVTCVDRMPQADLLGLYQKSKVYCQPSRREGLPNALCEAMLCECIPVGTRIAGIPKAIGETGFLTAPGEVSALERALRAALGATPEAGKKARERICDLFTLGQRRRGLQRLIGELAR